MDQNAPVVLNIRGERIGGTCALHEEHLMLYGSGWDPALGEKAFVIPGHCCTTVDLYGRIWLHRTERVTDRLEVSARGRSQ